MTTWSNLESDNPDLAAKGRKLLYQEDNYASAFLATAGSDCHPRVHPVFPVLSHGSLWLFIVNISPKYRDLKRNSKFALHSFPVPGGGEEFHILGRAEEITDPDQRVTISEATGNRQGTMDFESLFECKLTSVLHTHWDNWGTERAWPSYSKWIAD